MHPLVARRRLVNGRTAACGLAGEADGARGHLRELNPLAGKLRIGDFEHVARRTVCRALGRFGEFQKSGYAFFVHIFSLQGVNLHPANALLSALVPLLADS